jgi:serine/threonine-protein kinase
VSRIKEDYEKLGDLGRGASGVVFAARERATGRMVAVKALLSQAVLPEARERFLREAKLRLDSPHVVQVLDVRDEGGQIYMIQELVQGTSVDVLLERHGKLTIPAALRIGEGVARALAAAHAVGVVHRDVKPANVLVDEQGGVKLADFGIAKLLEPPAGVSAFVSLTATGQGLGTLAYVAPEQAADAKHVSPHADLYSLGATIYHMLAGRPPFLPTQVLLKSLFEEDAPPLRSLRPEVPPRTEAVVHRLLQKDPDDRPHDAALAVKLLAAARAEVGG